MVPAVLHRVIYGSPSPEPWQAALTTARPALLLSHQRRKVKHADYPGVVPVGASSASSVRGTLVTGLTEGDIHRLDLFEGDEYARREVRVKVASGDSVDAAGVPSGEVEVAAGAEEVVAETYIWTAGEGRLEADEWDFDEFVREKLRFWVGAGSNHEYAGRFCPPSFSGGKAWGWVGQRLEEEVGGEEPGIRWLGAGAVEGFLLRMC